MTHENNVMFVFYGKMVAQPSTGWLWLVFAGCKDGFGGAYVPSSSFSQHWNMVVCWEGKGCNLKSVP